ncbi:mandelate racemase/muconate lactonizing enzyme family protein [Ilumatobacter sp.]|uniref:mandelate racemase/muconate lactonizing enzyme family protein n=1 Tax=Ilumatobacter sp. TaxID=1967498 RepID=UPI003B525FE2
MTSAPAIVAVEPIGVSFGTDRERMSFLFVKVTADDGAVGWGEACDSYGCSYASVLATVVDDVFAPLVIGQRLDAVDPLADRMRLFTRRRLGDGWVAAQARSAVEIALWDLVARRGGRSISAAIGRVRDEIEVYASSAFLEEGPAAHHLRILGPLLDRGIRKVKVRTGPEWRDDLDTLADLRRELGDEIELMVDASETYTLPTARLLADALSRLDVRWLEEPIPQGERAAIEALVARSPVPVAYGEHLFGLSDAIEAMRRRQLDVLQPDASTAGGISEARRMAEAAASFGVRVVPHVCAGPVSLAANLHLAATVPAIRTVEYPPTLVPVWDTFGTGAPLGLDAITDGMLPVPDSPGSGVGLDEAVAADFPYEPPGVRAAGTTGGLPDRFVGDR